MRAEKQKVLFEDDWNPIKAPPELPPILLVVVDAEEEFDWSAPFSRDQRSVRSMAAQGPMHRIFEKFGIRPTYVVDYPVASQRDGLEPLRDLLKDDACLIGTQLHPWVNPPFDEEVSERNSFPGNLPPDLERAKLEALTRAIAALKRGGATVVVIGHRPSTLAQTERILVLAEGRLQLFGPRAAVIDHLKQRQVHAV